jgi:dCTP deaminase
VGAVGNAFEWTRVPDLYNMILSDFDLKNYIAAGRLKIDPIFEDTIRENGVDLRLGSQIARLNTVRQVFDTRASVDYDGFYRIEEVDDFLLEADEKILVTTMERVGLPSDLMGFVQLRSSFARTGLLLPPTIIDAGFDGNITIEIRGTSFPVRLYKGQRFAHIVFSKLTTPLEKPYGGKYQGQTGVTLPIFNDREKRS